MKLWIDDGIEPTIHTDITFIDSNDSNTKEKISTAVPDETTDLINETNFNQEAKELIDNSNAVTEQSTDELGTEILEEEITDETDDELDNSFSIRTIGRLPNPGTWCYMNSSLQTLFACEEFMHKMAELVLKSLKHLDVNDILLQFIHLYYLWKENKVTIENSYNFLSTFTENCKHFGRDTQEDVQEFLTFLLNYLEKDILKLMPKINFKVANYIKEYFNIEIENVLECLGCLKKSTSIEKRIMLSIIFHNSRRFFWMDQGIDDILKTEEVERTCEHCKHKIANCHRTFRTLPKYLFIHTNRIYHDEQFNQHKNLLNFYYQNQLYLNLITEKTKYDSGKSQYEMHNEGNLNLDKPKTIYKTSQSKKMTDVMYNIDVIIEHAGEGINSGHYYNKIHCNDDNFIFVNDDEIIELPNDAIIHSRSLKNSYIFLYHRS